MPARYASLSVRPLVVRLPFARVPMNFAFGWTRLTPSDVVTQK